MNGHETKEGKNGVVEIFYCTSAYSIRVNKGITTV